MKSDDYKNGWYDGYQAAKNDVKFYDNKPAPAIVPTQSPVWPTVQSCYVCGMKYTNPDGSLKSMGYVCAKTNCPSNVTSLTYAGAGGGTVAYNAGYKGLITVDVGAGGSGRGAHGRGDGATITYPGVPAI